MTPPKTREQIAAEVLLTTLGDAPDIEQIKRGIIQLRHVSWDTAIRAIIAAQDAERERCAGIAESMPGRILYFYDRPGGPPGNGYRPVTRADIAAAIRNHEGGS